MAKAPIVAEAVIRIDRLFAIEREINGHSAEARLTRRRERSAPILAELEGRLRAQRERCRASPRSARRSTTPSSAGRHLPLHGGRPDLHLHAAERAVRGIAVGRHNWTFAGSDRGGERAAALYTLIETAKLNGVDPQAWLADVLARLPDHSARQLDDLLPLELDAGMAVLRGLISPAAAFNPRPSPDAYD